MSKTLMSKTLMSKLKLVLNVDSFELGALKSKLKLKLETYVNTFELRTGTGTGY